MHMYVYVVLALKTTVRVCCVAPRSAVCVVLALRATVACKYCMSVHVTVYTLGMLPFPSMYNNWSGTYMCCECVLYCVTAV